MRAVLRRPAGAHGGSHLVVSRSGASTVAELAAIGRPAILVPLPHALDQDQLANAGVLAEAGGGIRLEQRDFTPERLAAELEKLGCRARQRSAAMAAAAKSAGTLDAAERLADLVLQVAGLLSISACWGCPGHRRLARSRQRPAPKPAHTVKDDRGITHETAARHRADAFRRHRRHRHERHRRGAGQSRLHGQGSDVSDSANVKRLRDKGITVAIGHEAENLDGADVVVVSSAIKRDNPELIAARAKRLPVVRRAEMLAELMRLKSCVAIAGTHGKTTTTSMVAALLDAGGLDPTVINGGIINAYGTNARLGAGDWMVVEADESDGTFLKLPADVAIVTNVDPEHLDHFKTYAAVQEAFHDFVENMPFYGFAVMCTDHPIVQALVGKHRGPSHHHLWRKSAGRRAPRRHRAQERRRRRFTVLFRDRAGRTTHTIDNLTLPMPGRHNALNATAAMAVAHELGIADDVIRKALAGFGGVKRRFTRAGDWNGVTIIDDYGHHPVEIAAVLRAAREIAQGQGDRGDAAASLHAAASPVRAVLHLLQRCRCGHRRAGLCRPAKQPIAGADRDGAGEGLRARGHRHAMPLDGPGTSSPALVKESGRARRLRRLPRRRQHHAMGLRAARSS